jgi:DNA-binding NarL/FixJ family response regulator
VAKIKVLIADNQALTLGGLQHFVSQKKDLKLLGTVSTREDFIQAVEKNKPHVLIVDYNLKEFISLDDLRKVPSLSMQTKTLVVSNDSDKGRIFKALDVGVFGYVTKNCSKEEIVNAIYATAKGEKFFCNKVLDLLLERHLGKSEEEQCQATELSEREVEIVQLITQGLNAKEIAARLHLSHHTVYTHPKNVMKKLQLSSAAELMLYAVKTGIINTNDT